MPKPYSMDLRERAIERFQSGESVRSVAAALSIGVSTAVRWHQRHRSTGSVAPSPMGGSEPRSIVGKDAEWLRERITSGDSTMRGLAAELKERRTTVDPGTVWLFLRCEGLSLKKIAITSERERPDVARKRERWKAHQASIDPSRLVFIDET